MSEGAESSGRYSIQEVGGLDQVSKDRGLKTSSRSPDGGFIVIGLADSIWESVISGSPSDPISRKYLTPSSASGAFVGAGEGSRFASTLSGGVCETKASDVEPCSVGLKPLTGDPIDPSGDLTVELSMKEPVSV